jgi:zinc transport system permease protein
MRYLAVAMPYPFELVFMQRALVASVAVGIFAPMIGTFLVQKRLSLIGDGIGHVAFAGVGAGLLAGFWPIWSALVFAVVGALAIEWMRSRRRASGDLALALLFYVGIALGVVFVSLGHGSSTTVLSYLFGQALTVTDVEMAVVVGLGAVIVVTILALRRVLFAVVTDEGWSQVAGLPVGAMNALLAVLTAVAVVAAMQIVGILLIAAMMVLPVGAGQLLARSFNGTMGWAVAIGASSSVVGLALARIFDLAPGGTIVLVTGGVFLAVALLTHGRAPTSTDPEPEPEPELRPSGTDAPVAGSA